MTNPTYVEVQYDVGDSRLVPDGTTAIKSFIAKSQSMIKDITGTTVGYDSEIRNLADAYAVNAMMGGHGPESVGKSERLQQRASFLGETERGLKVKGYAFDGRTIQFKQVNP